MELVVQAGTLVAIIALGQVIRRVGWVTARDFRVLSVIVVRITLPCVLITSFNEFTLGVDLLRVSVFGFCAVLLGQLFTLVVERRHGRAAQAFGVLNVGNFNIGLFTLPYLATFLGPEAVVVAAMFDLGNAIAASGLGYGLGLSLARGIRPRLGVFLRTVLSSPVFLTYLVMVTLGLARLRLPDPVIGFTSTVGAANTFLAMLMIGVGLDFSLEPGAYRTAARYLLTRWASVIVAILALWLLTPFSPAEKSVLTVVLCAPMAAMVTGFTEEAGLDVRMSTFMTLITMAVAILALPVALALTT